jgi:hypothetical protein
MTGFGSPLGRGVYHCIVGTRLVFAFAIALWACVGCLGVELWSVPWGTGGVGWVAQSVWGAACAAVWWAVAVQTLADRWDRAGLPVGLARSVGWLAGLMVVVWALDAVQPASPGWVQHVLSTLRAGVVSVWVGCVALGVCVPTRTGGLEPQRPTT